MAGSLNIRFKSADAATAGGYTVGFTANSKTASASITIADGNAPTGAETSNAIVSLAAQVNALLADVASLRSTVND